nr:ribonuclease D [Desulfobulbaceae bacterium]
MPYPIISTANELSSFASELEQEQVIAVDLEADSMHNYREKVCLLQFSTPSRTVLVDPLAIADISCLQKVLANPAIRKIFHAADYDIRSLYRDFKLEVRGLFDTMICCQFLGEEKVGLAAILSKYFDVTLDKRYQRADWSKRPLPQPMIAYAASDTLYLHKLAALLAEQLQQKNRLNWVSEEFEILEKVRHSETEAPLFLKAKGAWTLQGYQLAALEALLQWRDKEACRLNRPLFKVVETNVLLTLAKNSPATPADLDKMALPPSILKKNGNQWLKIIKESQSLPKDDLPTFPTQEKSIDDSATKRRINTLKRWRTGKSLAVGIDPGIMINTALLEEIAREPPATIDDLEIFAALKKWQRSELGPEIIQILNSDSDL